MKKIIFIAAVLCLLVSTNQVSAQLIIRNNGHAEIGTKPSSADPDTVTTLKLFADTAANAPGARITFGDLQAIGNKVAVGEFGNDNTDQLWLHGKRGTYITMGSSLGTSDTIAFFDPSRSTAFNFNVNVNATGIYVPSDERYKENIEPVEGVLQSLMTLEPVSYNLKSHYDMAPVVLDGSRESAEMDRYYRALEQGSARYGFLAQNVKDVFPELVHTDNNGYMSVDYIGLIPILVQSINELRAELDEVKAGKQELESMLTSAPAQQTLQQSAQNEISTSLTEAVLYQNAPNPWSSETVIRYRLPQGVVRADIYIYDMQGAQLKSIPAQGRGESQVTLTAHDLKAGMYIYALVADGALIDSKQMILTK